MSQDTLSASEFQHLQREGKIMTIKGRKARFKLSGDSDEHSLFTKEIVSPEPCKEVTKALTEVSNDGYDSSGEMHFSWWLRELLSSGYIRGFVSQPPSFILSQQETYTISKQLKTKTKALPRELFPAHIYTTDFLIQWDNSAKGLFFELFDHYTPMVKPPMFWAHYNDKDGLYSYVECKPHYDQNNMTRLFKINQKWVFSLFGKVINLAILPTFFESSFVPMRYLKTDKSDKDRKIDFPIVLLEDFINSH